MRIKFFPNRRQFLVSGVSSILVPYFSEFWAFALLGDTRKDVIPANTKFNLMDLFVDVNAPVTIGQKYVKQYPLEANISRLIKSIFGSRYPRDSKMLKISLSERISDDFRKGNIVIIDGWILARTEGRICALTAVLRDRNHV